MCSFREVQLSDKDEAVGAQGVPLDAGPVDRGRQGPARLRHAVFYRGRTPDRVGAIEDAVSPADGGAGHRLGDHGPARADIYFGAAPMPERVSGRLRHNMRFVILIPKSLDPEARAARCRLPDARPSEKIAKLFPPTDPLKEQQKAQKEGAKDAVTTAAQPPAAPARASATQLRSPNQYRCRKHGRNIKPRRDGRRHRPVSRYRRGR